MAGKNSDRPTADDGAKHKPKVLKTAQSTPSNKQQGVMAEIERVELAKYEVNTRSFHPNKQFEPQGFRFHGDDRGFALGESWAEGDKTRGNVTSRVWQRFKLDMALETAKDLSKDKAVNLKVASNTSKGGPGAWNIFAHTEDYKDPALQPKGTLKATHVSEPHAGQKEIILTSWYGGINHAFGPIKSETFTSTVVPVLDVSSVLFVKVERIQLYMDIAYLISGDGFPNCEAFIKDPAGNKLFIGRHIRIGTPDTHLWNNNTRFMCANAVRIELDAKGNFKDKLWVFTQTFGGPPDLRDQYPINVSGERHQAGSKPSFYSNPFNDSPSRFTWDIGKPEAMTQHAGGKAPAKQPLHLSAFIDISKIGTQLGKVWQAGPIKKTTRTEWNNTHLHQNPNEGRAPDSYDLDPSKWK
jgi:hypothetical protein